MNRKFQRAALYIRVSTREQAEKGYSIGEQEERLRAYCSAMEWTVSKVHIDPGFSGAKMDRPALRDMLDDVRGGRCDVVLVWKLDRLSRSQKDTLTLIEDEFLAHGVAFVSMLENFDTSTSFGRAMVGILSVFAQLEREQIKERLAMGAEARAKAGKWHGGGFDPFGYDYIDGRLVVNEYEAMIVREIFDLYVNKKWSVGRIRQKMADDYKRKKIARKGGSTWSTDTMVRSVLFSPIYVGVITWKGEMYPGEHEPLISKKMFEAALRRQEDTAFSSRGAQKNPFWTSRLFGGGLIVCGHCGAAYFSKGNYSGRGENRYYRPYYTCYSRAKTNKKMIIDPNCKNKSFPVQEFDALILEEIKKLAFDPEEVERLIAGAGSDAVPEDKSKRAILTARRDDLKKQVERLIALCRMGGALPIQDIAAQIEGLQDDIEKAERALSSLPKFDPEEDNVAVKARALFSSAVDIIDSGEFEPMRELITGLIDKIVINGEKIEIHWSFAPAPAEDKEKEKASS
jgi:site-specific DNA recombinase